MTAPANDNFADAIALSAAGGSLTVSCVDAGHETGEPGYMPGWPSVWYSWTPSTSGWKRINFDNVASPYYPRMYQSKVYTGTTLTDLVAVTSYAGFWGNYVADFYATAGTTYWVQVGTVTAPVSLTTTMHFGDFTPVAGDMVTDPITVGTTTTGSVTFDNTQAGIQGGERPHGNDVTMWFEFTPSTSGSISFNTASSPTPDPDAQILVYRASDVPLPNPPTYDTPYLAFVFGTDSASFNYTPGTTYLIRVAATTVHSDNVLSWAPFVPGLPPALPWNNPAGGSRTTSYVGIAYIGYDWYTYIQDEGGKGTCIVPANVDPEDLWGYPLILSDPVTVDGVFHYGDYIDGPLAYWYDADGYWSEGPNGGFANILVVDWGDGSPLEAVGAFYWTGPGPATGHVYADNGIHTVTLYSYIYFPPGGAVPGWQNSIPTNYSDTSLFWDVQVVFTYDLWNDDGPAYAGYTGPKDSLGLSVYEVMETGIDDSFYPRAMALSLPWPRSSTASGDMPTTHLSPPISEASPGSYWPGELFNVASYGGFDVGHNNDLTQDAADVTMVLSDVSAYSLVAIAPPTGARNGFSDSNSTYYDFYKDLLFGLDGYGRMIMAGVSGSGWDSNFVAALDGAGRSLVIKYPLDFQMFGTTPRLRQVYSDTELLVEVGDGNLLVMDLTDLDSEGRPTYWYYLTNLKQFKVGENYNLGAGELGRGNGAQRRADGGFWLLTHRSDSPTDSPHFPVHPIILGVGRDGAIDHEINAPNGAWATFDPGDFPDIGGAHWLINSVVGDPVNHDLVYALSSYLEPYSENRGNTSTGWSPPLVEGTSMAKVRYVSVVFRCGSSTPTPCVWLQHPNWFSTDGTAEPTHVRMMSIGLSSGWWTDSDYSGGTWQGLTRKTPNITVLPEPTVSTQLTQPKRVIFNPRPIGV